MRLLISLGLAAGAVAAALSLGCGGDDAPPAPPEAALRAPDLPPVPPLPEWPDDPPTPAKITLGTDIYFDVRLSGSGHSSCNGCHLYTTSFQDNLITGVPDRSYPDDSPALDRNTSSFLNIVYAPVFRWDGSHDDLVEVMAFPFSEPNMNLGTDVPSAQIGLAQRLTVDVPAYVPLYQAAFGVDITTLEAPEIWRLTGRALAAFMRQAVSRDSAFDRWNAGDDAAMSEAAVRGYGIFSGKARCITCHGGPFFTDFSFHNISSSPPREDGTRADEGRYRVTGDDRDRGAFLTPTLRNVYLTSPYFHDGSKFALSAVIEHLSGDEALADPNHDPLLDAPRPLGEDEVTDLVAFLGALRGTADYGIVPPPPNTP
jgi:cytochrome c peroxidase